jgi:succinate dehydrogenase / fumarate reductase flavoprotein subunit
VPRDIGSRAAKEMCDAGYGVGATGLAVYLDFGGAMKKFGKKVISERYGNLFDLYEKMTGINPYEEPMRIYPAGHYTMGGLWVDYNMMTTIPGLFAIGECNFSVHGANRLGASSLLQGAADGYFVLPVTIGNYLADDIKTPKISTELPEFAEAEKSVREREERFLNIKGKKTVTSFRKRLGSIMWDYCGIKRTEEGLKKALTLIDELKKEFLSDVKITGTLDEYNTELIKALRTEDAFEVAKLLCMDALNRNESCGAHFREEYQTAEGEAKRNDAEFKYVSVWEYQGEEKSPVLNKEDLNFEFVELKERNYK